MFFPKRFEKQKEKSKQQTASGKPFCMNVFFGTCLLLFAFCFLPFAILHAQTPNESSCISCHKLLDGEQLAPVTAFANDIHAHNGIGCESCHGGNPSSAVAEDAEAAMSKKVGYLGKPTRKIFRSFGDC